MITTPQSDNLLNRVSRIYVDNRSFKDDSGETVEYQRLVLDISINGELFPIEIPVKRDGSTGVTPKDIAILMLADRFDGTAKAF